MTSYKSVLHLSKIKAKKTPEAAAFGSFCICVINITLREMPLHIK